MSAVLLSSRLWAGSWLKRKRQREWKALVQSPGTNLLEYGSSALLWLGGYTPVLGGPGWSRVLTRWG